MVLLVAQIASSSSTTTAAVALISIDGETEGTIDSKVDGRRDGAEIDGEIEGTGDSKVDGVRDGADIDGVRDGTDGVKDGRFEMPLFEGAMVGSSQTLQSSGDKRGVVVGRGLDGAGVVVV